MRYMKSRKWHRNPEKKKVLQCTVGLKKKVNEKSRQKQTTHNVKVVIHARMTMEKLEMTTNRRD